MLLLNQDSCFSPVPKFFLCGENKSRFQMKCDKYGQKVSVLIILFVDTGYNRDHFAILKIKPN